eukprot:1428636-Prymnesium_polylepis.1
MPPWWRAERGAGVRVAPASRVASDSGLIIRYLIADGRRFLEKVSATPAPVFLRLFWRARQRVPEGANALSVLRL